MEYTSQALTDSMVSLADRVTQPLSIAALDYRRRSATQSLVEILGENVRRDTLHLAPKHLAFLAIYARLADISYAAESLHMFPEVYDSTRFPDNVAHAEVIFQKQAGTFLRGEELRLTANEANNLIADAQNFISHTASEDGTGAWLGYVLWDELLRLDVRQPLSMETISGVYGVLYTYATGYGMSEKAQTTITEIMKHRWAGAPFHASANKNQSSL